MLWQCLPGELSRRFRLSQNSPLSNPYSSKGLLAADYSVHNKGPEPQAVSDTADTFCENHSNDSCVGNPLSVPIARAAVGPTHWFKLHYSVNRLLASLKRCNLCFTLSLTDWKICFVLQCLVVSRNWTRVWCTKDISVPRERRSLYLPVRPACKVPSI